MLHAHWLHPFYPTQTTKASVSVCVVVEHAGIFHKRTHRHNILLHTCPHDYPYPRRFDKRHESGGLNLSYNGSMRSILLRFVMCFGSALA